MRRRLSVALLCAMSFLASGLFGHSEPPLTPSQARAEFEAKSLARKTVRLLTPPPGATLHGGGGGASGDDEYWRQRIETSLSSIEVLQHYAPQLDGLGWRRGLSHQEPDFALQIWTFTDEDGKPWRAILIVTHSATTSGYENLALQLIRLRDAASP